MLINFENWWLQYLPAPVKNAKFELYLLYIKHKIKHNIIIFKF